MKITKKKKKEGFKGIGREAAEHHGFPLFDINMSQNMSPAAGVR